MTIKDAWSRVKTSTIKAYWDKALGCGKTPEQGKTDEVDDDDEENDFEGFTKEEVKAAEEKLAQELRAIHHSPSSLMTGVL